MPLKRAFEVGLRKVFSWFCKIIHLAPQELHYAHAIYVQIMLSLEIWFFNLYFSLKPHLDEVALRIRRMEDQGLCVVLKTLLIQIFLNIRAIMDTLIDKFFGFAVYDENKMFRCPKLKDEFLLDSASVLADKIRMKELSSAVLVQAVIHRINSSNTIVSAMVDNRFKDALAEAKKVDKLLSGEYSIEELKKTKPFLGVPFTTKESVQCAGLSFTLGLVSRTGVKGEEDATVIKNMRDAGAILMGVTNIPELNLWCETRNMVYGMTNNPYNIWRTVGGSSGGEAALLSVCATPLGIGTDIGGSIRMPAFYCGIFGHKPTTGVVSLKGTTRRDGTEVTMACAGPMTRKSEDLIPFLKVLAGEKQSLLRLDEPVNIKSLRVMYLEESGDLRVSKVSNELRQIQRRVVNHLQEATGNPVDKVKLDGMQYSYRLWRYWMTKEPHQFANELGNREKTVSLPVEFAKKLVGMSDHSLAAIMKLADTQILPQEKAQWAEPITERLKKQILDALGDDGVLIFPSHPTTARFHYSAFLRPFNFAYWAILNVLQLPVTQVPLGLSSEGLPMGVQVASYRDHLSLDTLKKHSESGFLHPPLLGDLLSSV